MAEQRTFFVSVNLDDLSDEMDALDSTEERGLWLEGFKVGSRGHGDREGWHPAKAQGYAFGRGCWEKAEVFRAKKAEAGQASAEARRQKNGTAQPRRDRTDSEQCSGDVPNTARTEPRTDAELIHKPESINQEQETKNEEPHPPTPQGGAAMVVGEWNAAVEGTPLPKARVTPPRTKTIGTRLKESGWLEDFRAALTYVTKAPWCRGENDRAWIADLDFLLQPGKATQLAEKSRAPVPPPPKPGPRPVAPSARNASDQAWIERNPEAVKLYTPPPGAKIEPAW